MATKKQLEDWQIEDAQRLDALFKSRATLNQTDFGDRYGIGTQGMVWQYLSGRRPLNIKAAEAFARGLNAYIDEFSPTIAKQISQAAERISVLQSRWPFTSVDERKIFGLKKEDAASLEGAILLAAAQLGIDVKKD